MAAVPNFLALLASFMWRHIFKDGQLKQIKTNDFKYDSSLSTLQRESVIRRESVKVFRQRCRVMVIVILWLIEFSLASSCLSRVEHNILVMKLHIVSLFLAADVNLLRLVTIGGSPQLVSFWLTLDSSANFCWKRLSTTSLEPTGGSTPGLQLVYVLSNIHCNYLYL